MAAAAGAPGSGEGGEAEPDSEPISGDGRPDGCAEAAVETHRVPEDLSWRIAPVPVDVSEAEHLEPGLRLPENEGMPDHVESEVTNWESGDDGPGFDTDTLQAAPEPWSLAPSTEAEGVEPSDVDTGDKGTGGYSLSSQQEEEPMQLGNDLNCPLAPDHEGLGPDPVEMELEGMELCETSSQAEHPPGPVTLESASSSQAQVMAEQLESPSELMFQKVQEPETPDHKEVVLPLDSIQELESLCIPETAPMEALHIQAPPPVDLLHIQEMPADVVSQVQEPSLVEVMHTLGSPSDIQSQVETVPLEVPPIDEPVTVQEPNFGMVQEPAPEVVPFIDFLAEDKDVVPFMEGSLCQLQEPVPEVIIQYPVPQVAIHRDHLLDEVQEPDPMDYVEYPVPEVLPFMAESLCEMQEPVPELLLEPIPEIVPVSNVSMQELQEPVPEVSHPVEASILESWDPVSEASLPVDASIHETQDPVPEASHPVDASIHETQDPVPEASHPVDASIHETQDPVPETSHPVDVSVHESWDPVTEALHPVDTSIHESWDPVTEASHPVDASLHESRDPVAAASHPVDASVRESRDPVTEASHPVEASLHEAQDPVAEASHPVDASIHCYRDPVTEATHPVDASVHVSRDPVAEASHPVDASVHVSWDPVAEASHPVAASVHVSLDPVTEASHPVAALDVSQDPVTEASHPVDASDESWDPVTEASHSVDASVDESRDPVTESSHLVVASDESRDPVTEASHLVVASDESRDPVTEASHPVDASVHVSWDPVTEASHPMDTSVHESWEPATEASHPVEASIHQPWEPDTEVSHPIAASIHKSQEPVIEESLRPMEGLPNEVQESEPEAKAHVLVPVFVAEHEVMLDNVLIEHTAEEETVPKPVVLLSNSIRDTTEADPDAKTVETAVNSNHEPCKESFDPLHSDKCVPKSFHNKIQHELNAVSTEQRVLDLGVSENNQGAHPEIEMKLLSQSEQNNLEQGPKNEDLSCDLHYVTATTVYQASSPGESSVQVISEVEYESVPGHSQSPNELIADNAVTSDTNAITSEQATLGKELDSPFILMETEPTLENTSDCTKSASFSQDVPYDPFYRDTNTEQIPVAETDDSPNPISKDSMLEQQEAPMVTPNFAQIKDANELCLEGPNPPSINSGINASLDNPNKCQGPLPTTEHLLTGGIDGLIPGSEVQVTLDHLIQDALVVSFRHGDRIFSGVLMDLSKRFGPHGIPVTVHPKREYKNKPEEPVQPHSASFQEDLSPKNENGTAPVDVTPIQSNEPCGVHNLWTSKPPPLFHEGAPYPPPLFIRDTYNQSIPQPPPRKIKRLKKKIYREEPTSIMNAIKLRPRQVLCDKCKNVVADKKEVRKTGNDSFKLEEGKRRRHESVTTVNKKLKTDHKVNGKSESQKRSSVSKVSNLGHGRGKVVKVASQTNAPKSHLHTKKVLQSKNMDHAKAREVLKLAKEKAQKKQKDTSSSKNAHGKVHIARRLQNTSSGTLPPRLRIKPQRYRNEENDSSLKIGLESLRSSKMGIKPQTRYTATRSAGEAPSEITSPSNGPEEVSSDNQNTSACVPPGEQDEQQALSKRGSKGNVTVYMTLNQTKADSSSASVCSSDSTDDMKSIHSECSSTETFDFPPGSMHAPSSSSSSSSKEEKKLSSSLKIKMFSKNVSKCMTPDGRTICVGDIVWAKIYGFPWWPARILTITISRKDNGLLMRQEARIAWFGSPTTSFLALSQLSPFLENFQSRFNKKRKGLYRKAITEAAKAAKQLTPEVRALLTQFET